MTHLYIDSASIADWKSATSSALVTRATCNPLLMAAAGWRVEMASAQALVNAANALGMTELHLQAWPDAKGDWQSVAEQLAALDSKVVVKLPAVPAAMRCAVALKRQKSRVLVTAVSNPLHGLWAAEIGADFVAPYVNRLDKAGRNAYGLIAQLVALQNRGGPQVLAASIADVGMLGRLIELGVGAVTLKTAMLDQALADVLTLQAVDQFEAARAQSLQKP